MGASWLNLLTNGWPQNNYFYLKPKSKQARKKKPLVWYQNKVPSLSCFGSLLCQLILYSFEGLGFQRGWWKNIRETGRRIKRNRKPGVFFSSHQFWLTILAPCHAPAAYLGQVWLLLYAWDAETALETELSQWSFWLVLTCLLQLLLPLNVPALLCST